MLFLFVLGFSLFMINKLPSITSDATFPFLASIFGIIGTLGGVLISTFVRDINSNLDRHNQMRLAALDKRLSAHQEAYSLWNKLWMNCQDDQVIGDIIQECQSWWVNNCLYLEPNARLAFHRAYITAVGYGALIKTHANIELIKKESADIRDAGAIIVEGAALPSLGESETKRINKVRK